MGLRKSEINSNDYGILKLDLLWLEQTNSQRRKKNIFVYFSKYRMYNCIIVSLEHYVIEEEYNRPINVVDTRMKLDVYTWFQYQKSEHCTEANYITLLNSWVISAQRHFTNNTDFFPEKISRSFKGCPMKAIVTDGVWYFTTKYFYTDSRVLFEK
jgi:hypothetical protein